MNNRNHTLSLEQQALFAKKQLAFEERIAGKQKKSYYERLRTLLPEFKSLPPGKQEKFINAKQSTKYILGGFQSGKTETFGANTIWLAYENMPYPGLIISPTFDNAKAIMLKKLKEICEKNGIRYQVSPSTYSARIEFFLIFDKGKIGSIILGSGDGVFGWIGDTVAFGGMDEPFRQDESTHRDFISRISHPGSVLPMTYYSGTSEPDKQNWGLDIIENPEVDSKERFCTAISTRDNFHLRKGYVEDLEMNYDSETARNYIDGIPTVRKGGKMYYMFDDGLNVVKAETFKVKRSAFHKVMVVYDFNVNPMCAIEMLIQAPEVTITEDYKISTSNTWELTEVIIHRLRQKYDMKNVSLIITGDRTSLHRDTRSDSRYNPVFNDFQIIRQMFDKAGIKYHMVLPNENPDVRDRVQFVNNLLEKKYLRVLDTCKDVRDDLKYVKSKGGVVGFKKDKSNQNMTHLSDVVDYGAWLTRRMGIYPIEYFVNEDSDVVYSDPRREPV